MMRQPTIDANDAGTKDANGLTVVTRVELMVGQAN